MPGKQARASSPKDQHSAPLKTTVQQLRRAITLLQADLEKEREMREALQMQLIEANGEIVASWDRRKEMARVIADRDAEIKRHKERRKEMAQLIDQQQADLNARYQELAKLQRYTLLWSPPGWVRLLFRKAKRLGRKPS